MTIDRSDARPKPHTCPLPKMSEAVFLDGRPESGPTLRYLYDAGTRYICDTCGAVHVAWDDPGGQHGNVYFAGGRVWRRETHWQALRRRWRTRR